MTAPQYASLTAGLLARKGEASPSKEPSFGHRPWQPPVAPAPAPPGLATPAAVAPPQAQPPQQQFRPPPAEKRHEPPKVRLNDVSAAWPAPRQAERSESGMSDWVPARQQQPLALGSLGVPFKTTIRLTHAQARAVKLAALILDRPQQDILTAGLIERLEALACADLAKCTCFRAVIEGLKAPEPNAAVEEPPLAY